MINFSVQIIRQTPTGVPQLCLKQKIETEECSFIDETVILLLSYTCKFFLLIKTYHLDLYVAFYSFQMLKSEYRDL